jgi:hypothetical protein
MVRTRNDHDSRWCRKPRKTLLAKTTSNLLDWTELDCNLIKVVRTKYDKCLLGPVFLTTIAVKNASSGI